jgi:hypothetical protein
MRTRVASMRIAVARPSPSIFNDGTGWLRSSEHDDHDERGGGDDAPGPSQTAGDGLRVVARCEVLLRMRESRKTS